MLYVAYDTLGGTPAQHEGLRTFSSLLDGSESPAVFLKLKDLCVSQRESRTLVSVAEVEGAPVKG